MDGTARVWDQRTFSSVATIVGHNDEVGKSNNENIKIYGNIILLVEFI